MADPYNKVRISGELPGGEVWSINPCFAGVGGAAVDSFSDLQSWATAIGALALARIIPPAYESALSAAGTVNSVRTEYYDELGKLANVAEFVPNPVIRPSVAPNKIFQACVVMSLRTGRPGRSYRGRLYWPALSMTVDATTLRIPAATRNTLATQGAQWLANVAAAAPGDTPVEPVVVSQTLGINTIIERVEVGDVVDIQRRRRDSLVEVYSSAIVPFSP